MSTAVSQNQPSTADTDRMTALFDQIDPGFFERTRRRLSQTGDAAWRRLRSRDPIDADLPSAQAGELKAQIEACVSPNVGEMTARRRVEAIGDHYRALDETGRRRFFELMADSFGIDRTALDSAMAARREAVNTTPSDLATVLSAERAMRRALVTPRQTLFRRFNGIEDGVKFVVDLRADLRALRSEDPVFREMDAELKDLLGDWFDVGNLELREISWNTSAALLEKLIAYESVHEIESWTDLRNRLEADRRCYAFFHPGMPEEPLIFVEVALVKGLAGDLQELLDVSVESLDPEEADTAIFYSISNCQKGLAGVNLGDLLIKRVVGALTAELPQLTTFSTLSPIPGFRSWLEERLAADGSSMLRLEEHQQLKELLGQDDPARTLTELVQDSAWTSDADLADGLQSTVVRLAASYVADAKRKGRAHDRVANFHLSNGARFERLNWLANVSPVGLERSLGVMVNYRYLPENISRNHDQYVTRGTIDRSDEVAKILKY